MKLLIKGNIVARVDERSGSGQNGEWIKGDYLLKEAVSGDNMSITAWNDNKRSCDTFMNNLIECTIDIKSTEYNGRHYNNLTITDIKNPNIEQAIQQQSVVMDDVPSVVEHIRQEQQNNQFNPANFEDDLPF